MKKKYNTKCLLCGKEFSGVDDEWVCQFCENKKGDNKKMKYLTAFQIAIVIIMIAMNITGHIMEINCPWAMCHSLGIGLLIVLIFKYIEENKL